MPAASSVHERILAKIDRRGPNECWPWTAAQGGAGVPRIWHNGRLASARPLLWEAERGPLPPNHTVYVTCGSQQCMNLAHAVLHAWGDEATRFWAFVEKGDGCWLWRGTMQKKRNGYGQFKLAGQYGKTYVAHRFSWELHNGPINDPALFVCHKCDNPQCVRPDHLFLGTAKENNDDMFRKGRQPDMKAVMARVRERRSANGGNLSTSAKGEKP